MPRRRPRPTSQWHFDEMAVMIAGSQSWQWRAVDDEGEVLDLLVQRRRDKAAAVKLMRQRVKETRAAVIAEAAGSTYIHPAALFALSQAEIAHHSEAPRDYSWGYGDTDDAPDETTEEADGASRAQNDSLGPAPDADLDNLNSDENAHLDDEDPPIVQERTRAPRRHAATAE